MKNKRQILKAAYDLLAENHIDELSKMVNDEIAAEIKDGGMSVKRELEENTIDVKIT